MSDTFVNNEEIESVHIPRNYFYRPKKNLLSMEMGKIYPIYASLLIPNDLVELDTEVVIREQPTQKPTFSDKRMTIRYFVVACRNLDPNFYRFMTGFKEYSNKTKYEEPLKTWKPSDIKKTAPGTLWDCLGYPVNCMPDDDSLPLAFWKDAYNYIYDLYFRNQTVEDSILVDGVPGTSTNEDLLLVNRDRDFFTSSLPFQQLGDPLALPIVGNTSASFKKNIPVEYSEVELGFSTEGSSFSMLAAGNYIGQNSGLSRTLLGSGHSHDISAGLLNENIVSLQNVSSVFISELRFAFAMQLFQEMQARGGIRDNEFLLMHFGTAPTDETLGRPRYLGGLQVNILTEEVLQTSETTTNEPLGQIAGHGLAVGEGSKIRYHAKEFCVLLGLAYIKADTLYANQGMPKEFSLKTLYDFPLPIFGHLSEQPVFKRELLCASVNKYDRNYKNLGVDSTAASYNAEIFGYRPVYDWARQSQDEIHGLFLKEIFYKEGSQDLDYLYNLYQWTEALFFDIRDGKRPALNVDFIKATYDNRNYAIVDDTINRSQFLVWINNKAHYWRPLSKLGTPGRVDHII